MITRGEKHETETRLNTEKKRWSAPKAARLEFPKTAASHPSYFGTDGIYNYS